MRLLVAVVLVAAVARANPTARLVYLRDEAIAGCPDERALRDAVAARLGYDPFRDDAATTITATLSRGGRGVRAVVTLQDATGRTTGSRTLASDRSDCAELGSAVALAISIAVDPLALVRKPPPAEAPAPAPACPECPVCPPPPAPPRAKASFRAQVGAQLDLGAVPGVASLGITASAGVRWRAASIAVEGRVDPRLATFDAPNGRVGATLLLVELAPCAHFRWAAACALVGAGALQGVSAGIAAPRRDSTFYAAAGARLAVEIPLRGPFALALHGDLLATITRTTLQIDGTDAWATPPLSGAVGAAVLGSFE